MLSCVIWGAAHYQWGGPSTSVPVDQEASVITTIPMKGTVSTEPRDMVRVQLKPNDVRSYSRRDSERIITTTPGAFVVGEQGAKPASPDDEMAEKAQPDAPNKARRIGRTKGSPEAEGA